MGDVEAKRAAAVAAKEEKRKKEVEEIKARKKEMQAKRDAEKDEKSKEADAAEKKKAEVEAKRAENVKAKEAGRGGNKKGGSKYSKKDVMELKKVFDEYDKDGSGKVTLEEFTASLKSKKASSAPRPGQKSSLEERNAAKGISIADLGENVFAEMDRDGDGDVTFAELMKLMFKFASADEIETMLSWVAPEPEPEPEPKAELSREAKKQIKGIFNSYDKDKSGTLTFKELKVALTNTGIDPEEIEGYFKEFDKDDSDALDMVEFEKLMESTGAFDDM